MTSLRSGLLSSRAVLSLAATARPAMPLIPQLACLRMTSTPRSPSAATCDRTTTCAATYFIQSHATPAAVRHNSTTSRGADGSDSSESVPGTIYSADDLGGIEGLRTVDNRMAADLLSAAYGDTAGAAAEGDGSSAGGSSTAAQQTPPLPPYARLLPASPSYFTRQPHFNDLYLQLQALTRKYGHLPSVMADDVERVAWRGRLDFRSTLGEDVPGPLYNKCIVMVKKLHRIHSSLKPRAVIDAIDTFRRSINPYDNVPRPITIDRFGRAIGVGRRKTSTARAWVVEGTGEVLVNGKRLSEAFGRVHDRTSATWALRATERLDKYNVWALVEGGGTTGQAEALTMAVAKGLVAHEPALKTALRKAGCITRDTREVERKKPGHLKARKMPTWVKR